MKELEICGINDYINEFLNSHSESDGSITDITYSISLIGEKFTDDGDLEFDGYYKSIGESKDLSEAKQIAIGIKNTRLTLDTDSDVVMVQVTSITNFEYPDHSEQFLGREYTAQVEFMKGKEK